MCVQTVGGRAISDSSYRDRQPMTAGLDTTVRSAISVLDMPSAANNTIRVRYAAPATAVGERVKDTILLPDRHHAAPVVLR